MTRKNEIRVEVSGFSEGSGAAAETRIIIPDERSLDRTSVDFSPSGDPDAFLVRALAAALIQAIEDCGAGRCASGAQVQVEGSVHWAVKSVMEKKKRLASRRRV